MANYDAQVRVHTDVDMSDLNNLEKLLVELKGDVNALGNEFDAMNQSARASGTSMAVSGKRMTRSMFTAQLAVTAVVSTIKAMITLTKQGLEEFSKVDDEYGTTVSNFRAELEKLKASLASAFAPVATAILPQIQKLVAWLNKGLDAMAQFLYAMQGKTAYKKAKDGVGGLGKEIDDAGKKAKKTQSILASFDDINVLPQESDSGSSGGGSGSDAWETVEINPKILKVAEWLKEHMEQIKEYATAIGLALLAWKIASAFTNSLSTVAGLALAVGGAFLYVKEYIESWKEGLDFESLNTMLVGLVLTVGGLALAFGGVGAAIGLLVGGVALMVLGFKEWIKTGELSQEAFTAIEIGVIALVGALLLLGAPIAALVVAIAGVALAIYKYWDEIKAWFVKAGKYMKEKWDSFTNDLKEFGKNFVQKFKDIWNAIKEDASELWNKIKDAVTKIWNGIKETASKVFNGIKDSVVKAWNTAKDTVVTTATNMKNAIATKMSEIKQNVSEKMEDVKSKFSSAWENIKSDVTNAKGKFATMASTITTKVKDIASSVGKALTDKENGIGAKFGEAFEGISNFIKTPINAVIALVEGFVNKIIDGINGVFTIMNKLSFDIPDWDIFGDLAGKKFGFNFKAVDHISIPRLAQGGIVDRPTTALIGEAGMEAIVPLENNTEWMDVLAERIGSQNITIKFTGSMSELARVLKPALDSETNRVGTRLIVE